MERALGPSAAVAAGDDASSSEEGAAGEVARYASPTPQRAGPAAQSHNFVEANPPIRYPLKPGYHKRVTQQFRFGLSYFALATDRPVRTTMHIGSLALEMKSYQQEEELPILGWSSSGPGLLKALCPCTQPPRSEKGTIAPGGATINEP